MDDEHFGEANKTLRGVWMPDCCSCCEGYRGEGFEILEG